MIGDKFLCKKQVLLDDRTGRQVWKVSTWDDVHCVATYMYFQAFSGDGRYIVFASNRTGRYELYRADIESGETVQMTRHADDGMDDKSMVRPNISPVGVNVHRGGREVFFRDGNRYLAVDIETLEDRVVAECDRSDWETVYGGPSFSGDGTRLVCLYKHRNGCGGIAHADVRGSRFEDAYRWSTPNGDLGHIQGASTPDLVITFVVLPDRQNDPAETRANRARAWKLDAASGKAEPFLVVPPGHRATHEYWGPGGRLYFHRKTVPGWTPTSIASIDREGGDYREHFASDGRKLGHSCISPDGRWVVSDVQDPEGNELYRVDLRNGSSEILCWPDSTLQDGTVGHVHPSLNFAGDRVIYTSDRSGKAAVFIVPLEV